MSRILVIDDDDQTRGALSQVLRSAGYEVIAAADGKEGVKQHSDRPVDLVITDLFMPNQEGLETIMELRKNSPRLAILAISGGHRESAAMLAVAKQLGAARILEKPFDGEAMLAAVKEILA